MHLRGGGQWWVSHVGGQRRPRPGADKTNLVALPGTSWVLSFSICSLVEGLKIQASQTETPSTPALEMTSCEGIGSPVKN